jgi:hypothetical protein
MKTAEFIKKHPRCCFCGGGTPSETIDHQPAKIIFPEKSRPKGLEFPACERCNKQTGVDECVLAFVARMTGLMRGNVKPDSGLKRALKTISAAYPWLLPSMYTKEVEVGGKMLPATDLNKREVNEGLCRIAAKLALATYYGETGRIASPGTRINTMWTHNQRKDGAGLVNELLAKFPAGRQLKQGRWDTSDSFFIRFLTESTVERTVLQSAAVFHESVALMAQFLEGGDATDWEALAYTFSPDPNAGIKLVSQRWT